jgi:hypothetical protein
MTSPTLLAVLLAASAVTVATIGGWIVAAIAARFLLRQTSLAASNRAWLLAQIRLVPLAAVVILVPAQIQAFRTYEAGRPESAGMLLLAVAAAGVWSAINAARRTYSAWRDTVCVMNQWKMGATRLTVERWHGRAWAIHTPFPVVALAGVWRPQLFVARQVLSRCTIAELASIGAHEAAHAAAYDNLLRLLFELTPGARLLRRVAEPIERAWATASEEAADGAARESTSAVDLASALAKVARLAECSRPASMFVSTLIGGADLSTRVRRLLGATPARKRHGAAWIPAAVAGTTAVLIQIPSVSRAIHELFELLVRQA